ncbi:MAG: S41 family peptidase [Planctomycetota bacterium]|jgi:carboxyl-terminal processing protease
MLRRLSLLLVLLSPACAVATATSLQDEDMRAQLSDRVIETLRLQGHYFATDREANDFAERLRTVAASAHDATSYYRGMSRSLAALEEGHTGLVGSPQVPFTFTIPPVAILEVEELPMIAGVAPGVEAGGLRPGDLVLEVDGRPASAVLTDQLARTAGSTEHGRRARATANLLAGPTNTPAEVRVQGADGRERYCYPLRFLLDDEGEDRFRFGFLPHEVRARHVAPAAAYVSLPDFQERRVEEIETAVRSMRNAPRLVLDLRGNPGGRIRTLRRVAGIFVEEGVTLLELRDGPRREPVRAAPSTVRYRGQLRILVDERTGSAAELLAAALQDLGRAEIFGRTTAGSSRTRLSLVLPGQVVLHYAGRAEFRRRDGRRVEGVGVFPDVLVYRSRDGLARGEYGSPGRDPAILLALGLN